MLELKNIVKDYYVAGDTVHALRDVSIHFRENEFVSILGPSGCGKTTMLNIIGGLDKYTSGDLVIDNRSTKDFDDRDWDVYRNHRIGFVFQSYNLIPHQTILGNVELALTISGVSKEERTSKAKAALDKVGLKGQYNKKPNQLSGGQCQRVAIARALVNEPDILLADEPTGALDTVTSVQIMDLIKEISKDRLVIMVTHNPDLAEKYSTRIIRLLDGELQSDSNPYEEVDAKEIVIKENKDDKGKKEKAKMSFVTAFRLSFRNLFSKLKRTIMVIIAGSIGIIGVSSVLSVSTGVKDYIDSIQDDLLSGNPIQISKSGIDYDAIMNSANLVAKVDAVKHFDRVNVGSIINYLVSNEESLEELVYSNEFSQDYVNFVKSMPKDYYQTINLRYSLTLTPSIYTDFKVFRNGESVNDKRISLNAINETYTAILEATDYAQYSSYITSLQTAISEASASNEYINTQYDILAGHLPEKSTDVIVVLDKDNELSDLLLTQLGYLSTDEFFNLIFKAEASGLKGNYDEDLYIDHLSYEQVLNKKLYWYPNDVIYEDQSTTNPLTGFLHRYNYSYYVPENDPKWQENEVELNVCGIVKPKDNISYGSMRSGFFYTEEFAREIIAKNINSKIVQNILNHGTVYSTNYLNSDSGIRYDLDYTYYNPSTERFEDSTTPKRVYVGASSSGIMSTFFSYISQTPASGALSGLAGTKTFDLSNAGGSFLPSSISIYPNDFNTKHLVTDYLKQWNDPDKIITFYDYKEDLSDFGNTDVDKVSLTYHDRIFLKNRHISLSLKPNVWASDEFRYMLNISTRNGNEYEWKNLEIDDEGNYTYTLTEDEYNKYKDATFYKFSANDSENSFEKALDRTEAFEFPKTSETIYRIDQNGDNENKAQGIWLSSAKRIYFDENVWDLADVDERYAIYFTDGEHEKWYNLEKIEGDRFYSALVNSEDMNRYEKLTFVRFNKDSINDINNALSKTNPLDIPVDDYCLYKISFFGTNGDNSLGSWNRTAISKIKYTDSVELIINLINQMIDIVTYALVSFTALSLVVSTVMVGIITYVSVMERVKEIGVIRSLGGRKHDVSNLFYAETFMIGFASGLFGVLFTQVICIVANIIIKNVSDGSVSKIARLTWPNAISMILVSIILTSISGVFPAKSAARKDPVVALRTE